MIAPGSRPLNVNLQITGNPEVIDSSVGLVPTNANVAWSNWCTFAEVLCESCRRPNSWVLRERSPMRKLLF